MASIVKSVKLYANGDVRRFAVDGSLKFEILVQKIVEMYPTLKTINLVWKDKDDDAVVICNDEELTEAVKNARGGVLHLYLLPTNGLAASEGNKEAVESDTTTGPTLHGDVTCDACNKFIKGLRYKCLTCPDFDLCQRCESQRHHDEHPMIRIVSSDDQSWRKAFCANQWPCFGHFPFDHRPATVGQNGAEQTASASESTEKFPAPNIVPLDELITNALKALGLVDQRPATDGQNGTEQTATASKPEDKFAAPNLGPLGDLITNALKAFGSVGQRPATDGQNGTEQTATASKPEDKFAAPNLGPLGDLITNALKAFSSVDQRPATDGQNGAEQKATASKPEEKFAAPNVGPLGDLITNALKAFSSVDQRPATDGQNGAERKATASKPDEKFAASNVVPLGELIANALKAFGVAEPATCSTYDCQRQRDQSSKEKVDQALQQMLAMGFSNEDNWLTNLLTQMNGDISTVLDIIKPQVEAH